MADDPALRIFPDEYVPNAEGVSYHGKWVRANPVEASKWATFRDSVIRGEQVVPPSMSTKYGKALVAAGEEHMSISRIVGTVAPAYPPSVFSSSRVIYTLGDPNWNPTGTPGWWLDTNSSTGWTRDAFALPASSRIVFDDSVTVMQSLDGSYGNPGTVGPCRTVSIRVEPDDPDIPGVVAGAQGGVLRPYPDLYTNSFFGPPPDARPLQGETWWYGFAAKTNSGFVAHGQITPDLVNGLWNSFGLEWHVSIGGTTLGPIMQEIHTMVPASVNLGPAGTPWWKCNEASGWSHISPPRLAIALTAGLNDSLTDDATHTCRRIQGPTFTAGTLYKSIYKVKWDAFNQGEFVWWVDSGSGYTKYADMTGVSTLWRSATGPDTGTYPQLLQYRKSDTSLPTSIIYYGGFVKGSTMADVLIP